jgi:DNA-binding NarL/FixJ family response regulator
MGMLSQMMGRGAQAAAPTAMRGAAPMAGAAGGQLEQAVMQLLQRGLPAPQIADQLGVPPEVIARVVSMMRGGMNAPPA